MPDNGKSARDSDKVLAVAHSRRITRWLLDSRLASERKEPAQERAVPDRKAA
jgi:hypothetical protein